MSNTAGDTGGVSADAIRRLRAMTDSQVDAGIDKAGHRCTWFTIATAACFLAGVWLDWRFLPTAIIPAIAAGVYGHVAGLGRKELARRRVTQGTAGR